jgi:hypothetical protein
MDVEGDSMHSMVSRQSMQNSRPLALSPFQPLVLCLLRLRQSGSLRAKPPC